MEEYSSTIVKRVLKCSTTAPVYVSISNRCPSCYETFETYNELKAHCLDHSCKFSPESIPQDLHKCPLCDFSTTRKHDLMTHVQNSHATLKYKCLDCDYKFNTVDVIESHFTEHDTDETYRCHLCWYRSFKRKTIIRHLATHTPGSPILCYYPGCVHASMYPIEFKRHYLAHATKKRDKRKYTKKNSPKPVN